MAKWWIALLLCLPTVAKADLNDELNNFFDKVGAHVNTTSGEVYQGQKAGYMTGGGLTIRNRVMNSRPATVNLPRFDAGCGGIDIFTGGFSFINDEQLVETLKSIGSSAMGYAFLLGLETVSPQVSGVIKNLQTWSNKINALNINSCEVASGLVGSVWPKQALENQQVCRLLAGQKGMYSDFGSARGGCSQSAEFKKVKNSTEQDNELKDILWEEFNVAWEAIQKQSYLARDKELAEFFMSLLGTVIVRKDENTCIEYFPSKICDESFLNTLLEGGEATIYECNNRKQCLVVTEKKIFLSPSTAWLGRIKNQLLAMQDKILRDQELSEEEKTLLAKSRLPLYKIVNILTAYKKGTCPIDLYHIADIVAMDLLMQYLREVIELIREGAFQLKRKQMYETPIKEYLEELNRVEQTVRYYESRSSQLMEREFQLIQRMQLIEEQLRAEIVLH